MRVKKFAFRGKVLIRTEKQQHGRTKLRSGRERGVELTWLEVQLDRQVLLSAAK